MDPNRVAEINEAATSELPTVRKQRGRPMVFISARNFCTYVVVSDFLLMPYGRIHLEALSTNLIR